VKNEKPPGIKVLTLCYIVYIRIFKPY